MKKTRKISLQPKLLLGLVTMAAALALTLIPAITGLYRMRMEEYYKNLAFNLASAAAEYIDGDSIEKYYTTGEKDAYYDEVGNYLLNIKENVGPKYFYVVVPEEDVMVYIWDVGLPGEEGVCELGDSDAYYGDGYRLMHEAFAVDAEQTILVTENEEYGYLASAYVAILDGEGQPAAPASVDISMDMINAQIRQLMLLTLLVTLGVLVVSVFAYYYYVRRILIRPLKTLHGAATGLVEDNVEHLGDFSLDIKTGDELEDLSDSMNYMVGELDEYIKNLSRVTAEKERIGAELDVARHIQASMLPCIFPAFPERHEFDIYASMNPAKEVGGDFYDFFMVDKSHLAIVMADVSGKGVPAALFMVIGKTLIKDHTEPDEDLGAVFSEVNNMLCQSNSEGLFITAFEGVLDLCTGEFRYVNAGHEMPFIAHAGEPFKPYKIKPGFVLAGMEDMRYKSGSMVLEPGDKVFQYTDGVTEATDINKNLYGMERLEKILGESSALPPQQILEAVKADVDAFVGEAEQFDDLTMLALEFKEKMKEE